MEHKVTSNNTAHAAIATAVVIAAGTHAYAEPVRFDMPDDETLPLGWLDITRSFEDQSSHPTDISTSTHIYFYEEGDTAGKIYSKFRYYFQDGGLKTWTNSDQTADTFSRGESIGPGSTSGNWHTDSFAAGINIDRTINWDDYTYSLSGYEFLGDLPANGSPGYFAVRFSTIAGYHYGWIGATVSYEGLFSIFAWGYETEANTAIAAGAVPAPASLGMLAVGAAGALKRRKRVA